jgi:hypothetical protein
MAVALAGPSVAGGVSGDENHDVRHVDGSAYAPDDLPVSRAKLGEVVLGEQMVMHTSDTATTVPILVNAAPLRGLGVAS